MRRGLLFLLLTVGSLIGADARAHDVWITTKQDSAGNMIATIHHGHPGDRKTPDPDKLFEFLVQSGKDAPAFQLSKATSVLEEGNPVLVMEPIPSRSHSGIIILAARYDNGFWVKLPIGHRNTSKQQVSDAQESISSMKFAKALIKTSAEASETYQRIVGHRLELVPLMNPFSLKVDDIFKVQVLFDRKPLKGAEVERGDGLTPMAEQDIPRFVTDQQGIATVPMIKSGPQLLVIDHRIPSAHPDLATTELYNATLSFVMPEK